MAELANTLRDEREGIIDAAFASAKEGGAEIGPTNRDHGLIILEFVHRHGLALALSTHATNNHEIMLTQLSFEFYDQSEAEESGRQQCMRQPQTGLRVAR